MGKIRTKYCIGCYLQKKVMSRHLNGLKVRLWLPDHRWIADKPLQRIFESGSSDKEVPSTMSSAYFRKREFNGWGRLRV